MTLDELNRAIDFDADVSPWRDLAKFAAWLLGVAAVLVVSYILYARSGH